MPVCRRTWLYLEAHACLPVGVPAGAPAHTSASPANLERPCHPRGSSRRARPRHHEASDANGAFARTVPVIPGPSTRMAAVTSATSLVLVNATLSSQPCPQVGGSRWWKSLRTISASSCASPASLLPPDAWPSWPVPPATAGRSSLPCRVLPRCRRADSPRRLAACHGERHDASSSRTPSHEGALGPLWKTRREFWADRETPEAALRENFFSYAATRQRHVGTSPTTKNYDPDLWTDELSFLSRPGQQDIQTDLFYDYTRPVTGQLGTAAARKIRLAVAKAQPR